MKYILFFVLLWPAFAHAENPSFSCDISSLPAYPAPGAAPIIQTWKRNSGDNSSSPPNCDRFTLQNFTSLTLLKGRFKSGDDKEAMLRRLGAISTMSNIRYWSVTDSKWEALITDAAALASADAKQARKDFTPDEMKPGHDLYFYENDNRSGGKVIYKMHVISDTQNKVGIVRENASEIRYMGVAFYKPGDIQSVTILEELGPGMWGYYSLTGIRAHGLAALKSDEKSSINRAMAFYRNFVGIPTDQEPPAAK